MYNSRILNKQQSKTILPSSRILTETKLGETRIAEPTKNCSSMLYEFWSLGYLNQKRWLNSINDDMQKDDYSKSSGWTTVFDLVAAS
jgi:hypothetical protein